MCYSAQVWEDYHKFKRTFGADISIKDYVRLYVRRSKGENIRIPKGMDQAFSNPKTDEEKEIYALIQQYNADQVTLLEQKHFEQKTRLVTAERKLLTKITKKAQEEVRIANNLLVKIDKQKEELRRKEPKERDSRIYSKEYAPVMIWEDGKRVVKPMRYKCLPDGKPLEYETKYPRTYNARIDNLEGYWKSLFGHHHGIIVVNAFYESVKRQINGQEKSIELKFEPSDSQDMYVACLWSHWQGKDHPDFYSFTAITDEPPPEVANAGHDRCIIPIKPENIDAWLNPDPKNLAVQYAILDDRHRPYYEHQIAA